MILILSKKNDEITTERVIDCLEYYGADFYRLNGDEFYKGLVLRGRNFFFKNIPIKNINIVWLRRWLDDDFISQKIEGANLDNENYTLLYIHLMKEATLLSKYFHQQLHDKLWISRPEELKIYKSFQLEIAKSVGLKIPDSLVTGNKKELLSFIKKKKRIISKSISNPETFFTNKDGVLKASMMRTIEITSNDLNDIEENFFPTFFKN